MSNEKMCSACGKNYNGSLTMLASNMKVCNPCLEKFEKNKMFTRMVVEDKK